ncbi:MAG TPA: enoyl-CoA hydratase-related protein, partial [Spirochaetia bacterium]
AGADISEIADASPLDAEMIARRAQRINDTLESLPVPVIAAVNGLALGGGFELALACDFRVVAEDAVLDQPEVSLGIMPGAGGTQRLARLVGSAHAKEVIMLGRRIKGAEAYALGIATVVTDSASVMKEALSMAQKLKERPAVALRLAKAAVTAGENHGSDIGKIVEQLLFGMSFTTEDHREGMRAFREKRAPQYRHAR